jgi:hypothetical protein
VRSGAIRMPIGAIFLSTFDEGGRERALFAVPQVAIGHVLQRRDRSFSRLE